MTETINITPDWEVTTEWFARVLREHGFERNAREPILSFIEQVRYLALTDPDALDRIVAKLEK